MNHEFFMARDSSCANIQWFTLEHQKNIRPASWVIDNISPEDVS